MSFWTEFTATWLKYRDFRQANWHDVTQTAQNQWHREQNNKCSRHKPQAQSARFRIWNHCLATCSLLHDTMSATHRNSAGIHRKLHLRPARFNFGNCDKERLISIHFRKSGSEGGCQSCPGWFSWASLPVWSSPSSPPPDSLRSAACPTACLSKWARRCCQCYTGPSPDSSLGSLGSLGSLFKPLDLEASPQNQDLPRSRHLTSSNTNKVALRAVSPSMVFLPRVQPHVFRSQKCRPPSSSVKLLILYCVLFVFFWFCRVPSWLLLCHHPQWLGSDSSCPGLLQKQKAGVPKLNLSGHPRWLVKGGKGNFPSRAFPSACGKARRTLSRTTVPKATATSGMDIGPHWAVLDYINTFIEA